VPGQRRRGAEPLERRVALGVQLAQLVGAPGHDEVVLAFGQLEQPSG
jgi:hypothetical protein